MATQGLYLETQRKTPFTFPHALILSPSVSQSLSVPMLFIELTTLQFSLSKLFFHFQLGPSKSSDMCKLPFILLTTITVSTTVSQMCQVGP